MPPNSSFEFQSFNPFSINEDFKDNDQYPSVNFHQTQISSLDASNYIPNEVKEKLENFQQKSFSVLHSNIRSMSKNFESFRHYVSHSVLFVYQKHGASLTKLQIQIFNYLATQAYTRLGKTAEEEGFAFSYLNPFLTKSEMT